MICSLCLAEIEDNQETVTVNDNIRHKSCSDEYDSMVEELEKIADETCGEDI